jgi:hypothetical protein
MLVFSILQIFLRIFFSKFGFCDPNLVYNTLFARQGANVLQEHAGQGAPQVGLMAAHPVGSIF